MKEGVRTSAVALRGRGICAPGRGPGRRKARERRRAASRGPSGPARGELGPPPPPAPCPQTPHTRSRRAGGACAFFENRFFSFKLYIYIRCRVTVSPALFSLFDFRISHVLPGRAGATVRPVVAGGA